MKMLCFLAGELSNAAKYFITFADVNTDNHRQYDKTFGKDWKSFSYDKRLQDSAKVLREKLSWRKLIMLRVQKGKSLHRTFPPY